MRKKLLLSVLALICITSSFSMPAQADYPLQSRQGNIDATLGAGVILSPLRFDGQLSGEYFWRDNVSVGLALDVYTRRGTFFTGVPFVRYYFDIASRPSLSPYIGIGVGAGDGSNTDAFMDFMVSNFGFKYAVRPNILLGSDMSTHITTDFDGSDVDFRMLFITFTWRFGL